MHRRTIVIVIARRRIIVSERERHLRSKTASLRRVSLDRERKYSRSHCAKNAMRQADILVVVVVVGGERVKVARNVPLFFSPYFPLLPPPSPLTRSFPGRLVIETYLERPRKPVSVTVVPLRRAPGSSRLHSTRRRTRVNNVYIKRD